MNPPSPLLQLRDLDKTSPQFHKQLIDFLRGNEYKNVVPSLQNEDLAWLIEYLDSVSLQTVFSRFVLNAGVGPLRYFRSHKPCIPGITTRTQKDMRH